MIKHIARTCIALLFIVAPLADAAAKSKAKVIWIEEPESESVSEKELRRKVARLERAVAQLQRRVFELEFQDTGKKVEEKVPSYTCYIETPFEGLISETRASETEAKAATVVTCGKKTQNSLYCKIDKVKCGE